jgi:hypothetical protein
MIWRKSYNAITEEDGMLILISCPAESLKIGDDATVTFLALKDDRVRVGVSAPKNILRRPTTVSDASGPVHAGRARKRKRGQSRFDR